PVLLREPPDEVSRVPRQAWSSGRPPGAPPPEEAPAPPVPPDDRLRTYQHEVPVPVLTQAARPDPEQPVAPPKPRVRVGADGHHELLPQDQVLHHQRPAALERSEHEADEEQPPIQHIVMVAHSGSCRHGRSSRAPQLYA